MSKFTEGPWDWATINDKVYIGIKGNLDTVHDGFARVMDHGIPDEQEANARLIAAAPELLGALQFIMAFYEPGQTYLDTNAWKSAEASGRAALAKAKGLNK